MTDLTPIVDFLDKKYGYRFQRAYLWFKNNKNRVSNLTVEKDESLAVSASVKGETATYPVFIGTEGVWCTCQEMVSTRFPCKHVFYLLLFCLTEELIDETEVYELFGG